MKYLHPDVFDNGLNYLRNSAVRAVLLPSPSTIYADVTALSLLTLNIDATDFTLADVLVADGGGRKLTFNGKFGPASVASPVTATMHVAFTDGNSRVLWLEAVANQSAVIEGQNYRLQPATCIFPQPAQTVS